MSATLKATFPNNLMKHEASLRFFNKSFHNVLIEIKKVVSKFKVPPKSKLAVLLFQSIFLKMLEIKILFQWLFFYLEDAPQKSLRSSVFDTALGHSSKSPYLSVYDEVFSMVLSQKEQGYIYAP